MAQIEQDDGKTQKERMLAGELYVANDPELEEASRRAYRLMKAYEASYAIDRKQADRLLRELLGAVGPGVHIKPPLYVDYGINITVGAGTFANYGLVALDVARITIGRDVQIGPNVQLLTPTHPVEPDLRRAKFESAKPIVIGDNVWIGGGAIILPGVTIGRNSIIGAGAIVTHDVPADMLAVGNPARIVRSI
jgi:maltose O-acetyltransferase